MKLFRQPRVMLLIIFITVFVLLTIAVMQGATLTADQIVLQGLHGYAIPIVDRLALLLTMLGGLGGMIPLALLIAGLAFRWRSLGAALGIIGLVVGAYLLSVLFKLLLQRERPHLWTVLTPETDFSYPSGHALLSMCTVVSGVWLVGQTQYRSLALALGVIFVVLVGVSRVYLGVHYLSDVLAGWLIAGIWCTALLGLAPRLKKSA